MYNLNGKFNTFYSSKVVLKKEQKRELHDKKNLNIDRLKDGLIEYNEEFGTDYKLAEEPVVQGSVAMHTVTQNETNDYDIDVAIVFEKDNLPEGTLSSKRVVEKALLKKCTGFTIPPKAHTNCVRIVYQDGYHIDFAIYRRFKKDENNDEYTYEHCGSEWRERNPRSITKWFVDQNKVHNHRLREIVRLLKMFSKSRGNSWDMPGGLIQSVLADEKCESTYTRLDERFYYTIKAIKDRLAFNKEVYNPTDPTKSLALVQKDSTKMTNLYNRLSTNISDLDILFDSDCTKEQALTAWEGFFKHEYWSEQLTENRSAFELSKSSMHGSGSFYDFRETEEFIDYILPINLKFDLQLDCNIVKGDKRIGTLSSYLRDGKALDKGLDLYFNASTNVTPPYDVYWKTRNRGRLAKIQDDIRGQITPSTIGENKLFHHETTSFSGNHYVECYIVKRGVCVARKKIDVPIK
ncbi:nucleotide-binding domain-containing protein [Priestia megaterium]|uniref:nucleotide-binding domain-containing protein n=1 Tax=Priestia megaterium TaxID=1404 RepID=UPI0014830190|nr:nucleotidyltransferase [Priestia megaterium]